MGSRWKPGAITGAKTMKGSVLLALFGLPFLGFGLGFGYFKVWPEIATWMEVSHWQSTAGQLVSYRLDSSRSSEGGTTYEIKARFRYEVNGRDYEAARVGIHSGKDNIGDYHQQWEQRLRRIQSSGKPLTVWYDPERPDQALLDPDLRWGLMAMQAAFAVVFTLIGGGLLAAGLFSKARQPDVSGDGAVAESGGAVLDFSKREPIAPGAATGVWAMWLFAVIWNLISFPACIAVWDELQSVHGTEDYLVLIVLLFPAVGLFLLWLAIKGTILNRRYGRSRLQLDPNPGQAGGQVGGEILLSKALPLNTQCEVRLECLHSRETRNSKGQKRISTSVERQDALTVRGAQEAGKTRIRFVFDVPAELPSSQAQSSNWHHWKVHVAADIPGLDLALDFEIPVQQGAGKSRIRIAGRERKQQMQRSQQLAQVLNIEQKGETLFLHSDYGRELAGSIMGAVFGAIFLAVGIGIGFAEMGPGLIEIPVKLMFCTVFGGLGLLILLACVLTPMTRLDTAIDRHNLHVRRLFLGREIFRKTIALQDVTQLQAHKNSSYGNGNRIRNWFQLRVWHNGKKQVIAESVPGRVLADEAIVFLRSNTGLP